MGHHVTVPGDQFWNLYAFVSTSRHITLDFVCLFITIVSVRCVLLSLSTIQASPLNAHPASCTP